jgi:DNA-binding transcriptional LysR family regulator
MDSLTLDQIQLFLTVVDEGSFTKAAKKLNRAQSAVTYGIQKLEDQVGLPLFDRATYRPSLTEAGATLLSRARRVAEEANGFRESARSLASGLEAELSIVLDAMFPMPPIAAALRAFSERFPTVPPRIYVQSLGASPQLVLNGTCAIGLMPLLFSDMAAFRRFPLMTIDLIPVVAPDHPLAAADEPIENEILNRHAQLVLTDRSDLTAGRDFGVLSGRTWRLADLSAKHAMLLAGLGWGKMPAHLVEEDIKCGRLKVIQPAGYDARSSKVVMSGAYLASHQLGPAGQWMIRHLSDSLGS